MNSNRISQLTYCETLQESLNLIQKHLTTHPNASLCLTFPLKNQKVFYFQKESFVPKENELKFQALLDSKDHSNLNVDEMMKLIKPTGFKFIFSHSNMTLEEIDQAVSFFAEKGISVKQKPLKLSAP